MNLVASRSQLRASLLRWTLFLVPLVVLLGFISGQLGSGPNSAWFIGLEKPAMFPPPAVFGIVWAILYAMIGFAAALVASAWGAYGRSLALGLFALHFVCNLAWTPVFFVMQDMWAALVVIGLMVASLLPVIWAFARVRKAAGLLLLPYLAWVIFAGVLNYQFIAANPDGGAINQAETTKRIAI